MAARAPVRASSVAGVVQKMENDLEQYRGRELCVVCLTNKKTFCAVPCGHLVWCDECKESTGSTGTAGAISSKCCPMCRADVTGKQRIYY